MSWKYLQWVWKQTRNNRAEILLSSLCGLLRVSLGLTFVWVSKLLVDSAISNSVAEQKIITLSVILVSLLILEMAFSFANTYFSGKAEARIKNKMRSGIYNHLLGCRWENAVQLHSGDLLNRITEDVRVITEAVCKNLPDALVLSVQFVAAFLLFYFMSWQLALCVVCILPFFLIVSKVYVRKTRKLTTEIRQSESKAQTVLQEGLQHHAVIQTLECEGVMSSRLTEIQDSLFGQTMHRLNFGIYSRTMLRLGFIACYSTAFIWSIWHLRSGEMTYGMMTAFLQLVARIQNPMVGIAHLVPNIVQALSSIDRIKELEDLESEECGSPIEIASPIGIRISDISFKYKGKETSVYHHFSHDFAPGSKTMVMGETGAGKSTLVKLLLALNNPQEGSISLYSKEKEIVVGPQTRCNFEYVPQGNSLLAGTIRSNLLLGNPAATEEEMREALYIAAAEFVWNSPEQLATPCGELGNGLSEGQAQRIAIARALLHGGGIILFDEYNSSLDETTAETLIERLVKSKPDCTMIFISHRQTIAKYCDEVLKIEGYIENKKCPKSLLK